MPELRSRVLPPDFWLNFNLGSLGDSERLLFQFLVQYADDFGRFEFDPNLMRGLFWMYQPDRSAADLVCLFNRIIERCGYLGFYQVNGHNYYAFTNWSEYQNLRHPKKSSVPCPETVEIHRAFPNIPETSGNFPKTSAHIVTVLDSVSGSVVVPVSQSCPPQAVDETATKPKRAPKSPDAELLAAFDEFWKIYPRKEGKTPALRTWVREIRLEIVPDVIQAAIRYAELRYGEDGRFTKHAATWLNKGTWRDSLTDEKPKPPTGNGNGKPTVSERNRDSRAGLFAAFGAAPPTPDSGARGRSLELRGADDPA